MSCDLVRVQGFGVGDGPLVFAHSPLPGHHSLCGVHLQGAERLALGVSAQCQRILVLGASVISVAVVDEGEVAGLLVGGRLGGPGLAHVGQHPLGGS